MDSINNYARRARHDLDGTVVRLLWIAGRLQSCRRISSDVARREYGISQRTRIRDLQRLRAAGFILILQRLGGDYHFAYGGFDPSYAETVRMGPYELDEPHAKEKPLKTWVRAKIEQKTAARKGAASEGQTSSYA